MAHIEQAGIDDLKETLKAFSPSGNRRAISRARSTAIRDTKSETGKQAAKVMALRSKAANPASIRKSLTSRNVTNSGSMSILGKYIQGHMFENELAGPKPPRGSAPVSVRYFRTEKLKKQDGYFRTKRTKYKASPIKKRVKKSRYPLKMLWGPTVFDVYGSGPKGRKRQEVIVDFGAVKYQDQLSRQIDLVLRGL